MRIPILVLLVSLFGLAQFICPTRQQPIDPGDGLDLIRSTESRQNLIRQMALQAWLVYKVKAWGQETFQRRAATPEDHDPRGGCEPDASDPYANRLSGETIFQSLTTLWILNMKKPFEDAKEWIQNQFDPKTAILPDARKKRNLHTFIAPLLSTYALTGDEFFLNKSIELGELDLRHNNKAASVEEQLIEYQFLSHLSGNSSYIERVRALKSQLWRINMKNDEDYYLSGFPYGIELKRAAQLNFTQRSIILDRYRRIIDQAEPTSIIMRLDNVTYYQNIPFTEVMMYKHCTLGAILAQGAELWDRLYPDDPDREKKRAERDMIYAGELTEGCAKVAQTTASRLPPYKYKFRSRGQPLIEYSRYELSPELPESQFVLWRKTSDPKYREAAWNLTKAIYRQARFPSGSYGCVKDVTKRPTDVEEFQPVKLLSGTFKYLYMIFSDDKDLMPSGNWVWNTQGHPFPVCGTNEWYPDKYCARENLVPEM